MTTYTARFHSEHAWATEDIEAETPEQALQQARARADDDPVALDWWHYDGSPVSVHEIEIEDSNGESETAWQSDELSLRVAASDLLAALETQTEAAQAVVDCWVKGDLAGAVRMLDASIPAARAAIAAAKPPAG